MKRLYLRNNRIVVFYGFFFIFLLVIHFFLPLSWADDAVFFKKVSHLSLPEFLRNSARPIIDSFTYFFVKKPLLWRMINPLILVLSSRLLSEYLSLKNDFIKTVILSCLLIYPAMVVVDAGFIATTLNYLWPVTFALLCLLPTWKKLNNSKPHWFEQILFLPCLLYATNMQQTAVILVILFGIANFYFIFKNDFSIYIMLQFFVSSLCLIYSYIINTSGDNSRMLREINRYFPEFSSLSFFEKAELGFSSTFYCLTLKPCFAWFAFFIFLSVLVFFVFKKTNNIVRRIIVSFPLLFSVWGLIHYYCPEGFIFPKVFIPGDLQHYNLSKAIYSFEPASDMLFIIVVLCILYALLILIDDKKKIMITIAILFSGLGSRILMGFSPTVWASGYRTFYLTFISLIIISLIVIKENKDLYPSFVKK